MKKENWLLREIESWQAEEIINTETADKLKSMYQPRKNIGSLIVLFSIIGSLLIGMGIVLVRANNWWYSLPVAARAVIGFLPLILSQIFVFFVLAKKTDSTAFRESAALINMAGVFSSVAMVYQIFHIPGDFTNYLLICGILSLPSMLIMNAVSPLIICFWSAINGGLFFSDIAGIIISLTMLGIGAVFALKKCNQKNNKSIYLSLITVISAFSWILAFTLKFNGDLSIILLGFCLLLLSVARLLTGGEAVFRICSKACLIILTFVITYQNLWQYNSRFTTLSDLIVTALPALSAIIFFAKNLVKKNYCIFSLMAFILLILRSTWCILDLTTAPFDLIFMIATNVLLFALSIFCIFNGAKKIDLYTANLGMLILCVLIVMRFFDSELSLAIRGVVFLILGAGFLLFNLYLLKTKKKIKEATV